MYCGNKAHVEFGVLFNVQKSSWQPSNDSAAERLSDLDATSTEYPRNPRDCSRKDAASSQLLYHGHTMMRLRLTESWLS